MIFLPSAYCLNMPTFIRWYIAGASHLSIVIPLAANRGMDSECHS
jgi:hypothetical protein